MQYTAATPRPLLLQYKSSRVEMRYGARIVVEAMPCSWVYTRLTRLSSLLFAAETDFSRLNRRLISHFIPAPQAPTFHYFYGCKFFSRNWLHLLCSFLSPALPFPYDDRDSVIFLQPLSWTYLRAI